jgi:hypothetical protein
MGPDAPEVLEAARKVRMCLLQYRFERFRNISIPKVPSTTKLSGRPLDLYRALALPFDNEPMMRDALAPLIEQQDKSRIGVLSPVQASTLRVLDLCAHTMPDAAGFWMKSLTADVNSDLESRGERCRVTERKLGDLLTSLSFPNRTRKNTGYVLWLDRADRERLHASARDHRVDEIGADLQAKCELCAKASAPPPKSAPADPQIEEREVSEHSKSEGSEHRERQTRITGFPVRASNRRRPEGVHHTVRRRPLGQTRN